MSSTRRRGFFVDSAVSHSAPATQPATKPPHSALRISLVLALLLAGIGGALADHLIARPGPAAGPPALGAAIVPAAAESSAWYCTGGTPGSGSTGLETLQLLNTSDRSTTATVGAVSDTGVEGSESVAVPARAQVDEAPGELVKGAFVAATVKVAGGAVLVTETVAGPLGWSEAPCSRSTASSWYFASGSTVHGGTLAVSLYNPTTTVAVVDMTFVTPSGIAQPQPFEGIVIAPGDLAVEEVDRYVQDARSVSTIVTVRTGSVVAAALQAVSSDGVHGLSLRLGSPQLFLHWAVPRSIDVTGGQTAVTIFNPSRVAEKVQVHVEPYRSPPATFTQTVGPLTAWVLETSADGRIPVGIPFLATVGVISAGSGVVVDRSVVAPWSFGAPQFGAGSALGIGPGDLATTAGVFTGPGTGAQPAVMGSAIGALDLYNPGTGSLDATVWALGPSGLMRVAAANVRPGHALSLSASGSSGVRRASRLGPLGPSPLVVTATEPVLVLEDLTPGATAGVVSLAAAVGG